MLEPPGQSTDLESKRHIVNYMRVNFNSWVDYANGEDSWGLELRDHDIAFICGTTKTTRWLVSAYQGDSFREKEGYVSGDFGPFASANLSVHISDRILPTNHYRTGPSASQRPVIAPTPRLTDAEEAVLAPKPNQCIFVHYYKMQRRQFWWPVKEPMRAAAGPDDPGDSEDPDLGSALAVPYTGDDYCEPGYTLVPEHVTAVGEVSAHRFVPVYYAE